MSRIKFHDNPFIGNIIPCRQTDGQAHDGTCKRLNRTFCTHLECNLPYPVLRSYKYFEEKVRRESVRRVLYCVHSNFPSGLEAFEKIKGNWF